MEKNDSKFRHIDSKKKQKFEIEKKQKFEIEKTKTNWGGKTLNTFLAT